MQPVSCLSDQGWVDEAWISLQLVSCPIPVLRFSGRISMRPWSIPSSSKVVNDLPAWLNHQLIFYLSWNERTICNHVFYSWQLPFLVGCFQLNDSFCCFLSQKETKFLIVHVHHLCLLYTSPVEADWNVAVWFLFNRIWLLPNSHS